MRSILQNKKGATDLIYLTITLLTVALLGLLVLKVITPISDEYREIAGTGTLAERAIDDTETVFTSGLDNLFLGIYVILLLGMGILAFFISSSVVYLILFIIIAVIATWFAAVISNVYMEIEATGLFATVLTLFPKQTFIMENLPILTAAAAFLLLIITYSKNLFVSRQEIQ